MPRRPDPDILEPGSLTARDYAVDAFAAGRAGSPLAETRIARLLVESGAIKNTLDVAVALGRPFVSTYDYGRDGYLDDPDEQERVVAELRAAGVEGFEDWDPERQ